MEQKIKFQKLTPTSAVDLSVYEDAFEYVFDNDDIRNIAISGPYSAGKSSLLESYKKSHKDKTFLHISLAHFKEPNNDEDTDVSNVETVLEGKILNQLIQQIDEKNIPQTNFRIKRATNNNSSIIISLLAVLFTMCILHLSYFDKWCNWVCGISDSFIKKILLFFTDPYTMLISGVVALIILGMGIRKLLILQKNKNIFRKLNFQGNEIEIFGDSDSSYFDKYLNEVLYIFENSGVDAIVFEDIDRFDDNKIFERLREINTLTNIRLQRRGIMESHKVVRFFYLLRDDIFINKERTKFFDYILPVVPVLDSSNAYDQLKGHLEEGGIFSIFDEKFLRGLALYIDDMRVLKNIYNEFLVYYNKLNIIELNPNKMLAMMAYKNIFPKDFSDLRLNQGFVYELFINKSTFKKNELDNYEKKIGKLQTRIAYVKNETLESIQELDDVKKAKNDRIPSCYGQQRTKAIETYDKWVTDEYPLRKQAIEDRLEERLVNLEAELSQLQAEKNAIINMSLHEIITRQNIDEIFKITSTNELGEVTKYEAIKSSEYFALLKYLIRHGYIDESYNDYMTFFYANSLTKVDKMFLRSITDRVAKPFDYELDNVPLVMSNLTISDFEQEETLNFDLFEYLLKNPKHRDMLLCVIKQLKDRLQYQFISAFFGQNRERRNLVVVINQEWPSFFGTVMIGPKIPAQQIYEYSIATLEYMKEEGLQSVNIHNCLASYISSNPEYLVIANPNIDKMISSLKFLDVKFDYIDNPASNKELLDEVYNNSLYRINYRNIWVIFEKKYNYSEVYEAMQQSISSVYSQPEQPLCKYVQENKNIFFEAILATSIEKFTDDEDDIVMVLNDSDILEEYKRAYIGRLGTIVEKISSITDKNYQKELITQKKVFYSEKNILEYFGRSGLDPSLVEFINEGDTVLNLSLVENEEWCGEFWESCIESHNLSLNKYEEIISSIEWAYSEFDIPNIPAERMKILIEHDIIPMTEDILIFMRSSYPDIVMEYIENNLAQYVDISVGDMASLDEVMEILKWNVTNEIKMKVLSEVTGKISVVNQEYSNEVMKHILNHNFDETDIPVLFERYDTYAPEIKSEIITIAKRNLAKIISASGDISKELVMKITEDNSISIENRVNTLIPVLRNMNDAECMRSFNAIGLTDIASIFETNRRPKVQINAMNKKVLDALKECGQIASFLEDKENNVYKQFRRSSTA